MMNRIDRDASERLATVKPLAAALLLAGLNHPAFAEGAQPQSLRSSWNRPAHMRWAARSSAKPGDPSQTLSCDHGYVEYFIPAKRRSVGLIMWHSSSTKVWENRWDGGEGYKSIFLRKGYPVYLWDGPRVGRANWSCEPITYTPDYFDQRNFAAWRFGVTYPNWHPGLQFPTADKEAWKQATRARYDEFDTLENALLQAEAGGQAIDKIGPVIAAHQFRGRLARADVGTQGQERQHERHRRLRNPGLRFPGGRGARAASRMRRTVPMRCRWPSS